MLKIFRRAISITFLVVSTSMLVWALIPTRHQVVSEYLEPTAMQLPSTDSTSVSALMEVRQVQLEWPKTVRIGEPTTITLIFKQVKSEIISPKPAMNFIDVYENYNLMAEGRYEVAGVTVDPANPRRVTLPPDHIVRLKWQVITQQPGNFPGEVWLLLRFVPLDGSQPTEVPIFIHELDLRAIGFLRLSAPAVRLLGSLGLFVSIALNYDVVINIIKKTQWKRNT